MMYVDISGRLLTGIAGSNPVGGMDVCRKWCVVRGRSLRLADLSSRGVLPSVVCLSVIRCNITPGAWMCVVSGVLSGGDLCDWPIPRSEEFYRVWCV